MNILYKIGVFIMLLVLSESLIAQRSKSDNNDITFTYIEAIRHKNLGNFPQAAFLFKKIADTDTLCASCYYELSLIFLSAGDAANGLTFSEKAWRLDKTNYWYVKNYADYLRENQLWSQAAAIYTSVVNFSYASKDDYLNLASCYIKLGKDKDALLILNNLEAKYSKFTELLTLRYKYFLSKKNYSLALKDLHELLKSDSLNVLYLGMKAELFAIKGKNDLAREFYLKLLNVKPNNIKAHLSYAKFNLSLNDTIVGYDIVDNVFYFDTFNKSDQVFFVNNLIKEKDNKGLISNYFAYRFKKVISNNDTNLVYRELICDYYESRQDYENAEIFAKSLIERSPENGQYWDRYFYYLNILKKYDVIWQYAKLVSTKFFDRPFLLFFTGLAAYLNKDISGSISFLKQGLNYSKENSYLTTQIVSILAENYYQLGNQDSAFYYFELAIEQGVDDVGLLNNYAYYLALQEKNLDKALKMSRITIEKFPESSTFLDTYAWVLFKLKLYKEAYFYIKKAYKFNNDKSYEIIEHYGDILFCIGKKAQAKKMWQKASSLKSDNELILKKISGYECP